MVDRGAVKSFGLTLLLVGVTAIWGWTFTVVRDAVAVYGVLGFLAIRFTIATAVLAPLSARRMTRRTLLAGLAIGLVLAVAYLFQTLGLKYTTPTNCGLVTGLFIVFVPFFDRILYRIRIRRLLWLAVAVSLTGMVLLVGQSPGQLRTGDALTVVAAGMYGLHVSLLSRRGGYGRPGLGAGLLHPDVRAATPLRPADRDHHHDRAAVRRPVRLPAGRRPPDGHPARRGGPLDVRHRHERDRPRLAEGAEESQSA